MSMTTIALDSTVATGNTVGTIEQSRKLEQGLRYNMSAFLSLLLVGMFVLYFCLPHTGALAPLFHLSILYLIVIPLAAFILSIIGIRQISKNNERGMTFGVISLFITSLYLIIVLATPIVLLGCYIVYAYLLP